MPFIFSRESLLFSHAHRFHIQLQFAIQAKSYGKFPCTLHIVSTRAEILHQCALFDLTIHYLSLIVYVTHHAKDL